MIIAEEDLFVDLHEIIMRILAPCVKPLSQVLLGTDYNQMKPQNNDV